MWDKGVQKILVLIAKTKQHDNQVTQTQMMNSHDSSLRDVCSYSLDNWQTTGVLLLLSYILQASGISGFCFFTIHATVYQKINNYILFSMYICMLGTLITFMYLTNKIETLVVLIVCVDIEHVALSFIRTQSLFAFLASRASFGWIKFW